MGQAQAWEIGQSILDFGFWILDFRLTPCLKSGACQLILDL